jgi:hypothetical protein
LPHVKLVVGDDVDLVFVGAAAEVADPAGAGGVVERS